MPDGFPTRKPGDPLSDYDLMIAGADTAMQLRFKPRDQLDLRRVAEIFRQFANRLEIASDPRRFDERTALSMARWERKLAQDRLASKPKRG